MREFPREACVRVAGECRRRLLFQHPNVLLPDDFPQIELEVVVGFPDSLQFDDHFKSDPALLDFRLKFGVLLRRFTGGRGPTEQSYRRRSICSCRCECTMKDCQRVRPGFHRDRIRGDFLIQILKFPEQHFPVAAVSGLRSVLLPRIARTAVDAYGLRFRVAVVGCFGRSLWTAHRSVASSWGLEDSTPATQFYQNKLLQF